MKTRALRLMSGPLKRPAELSGSAEFDDFAARLGDLGDRIGPRLTSEEDAEKVGREDDLTGRHMNLSGDHGEEPVAELVAALLSEQEVLVSDLDLVVRPLAESHHISLR